MSKPEAPTKPTKKDFASEQEIRWCPGCGDYAILNSVQAVFARLGIPRENFVVVSGIGCSSRFPYYMNTYGFHTVHGRAPSFATGVKLARPELSVWVVTGDGDGLAIGGNHLMHAMRRNIDITLLLFNNRIYGLTKGQYSPTSERGKKTVSTPLGSLDRPYNPISLALGASATFVARSVDRFSKHLQETLEAAAAHKGASFVEIFQNCNIFNDGAFANVTDKDGRVDNVLYLEHGAPLRFGKDMEHGIRLDDCGSPRVVDVATVGEENLLVHDVACENPARAFTLSQLDQPAFPVPIGVFRAVEAPTLDGAAERQMEEIRRRESPSLESLLSGPSTWQVE
ncbi:MAG: 2-oxoacid:ferredoxin oxidoreductase subunit beta [Acidobacteriota bacterium]|nr:2-oxoacid:ferredoxin oxidoreductase subunit beta [Acidobacteriota bacterium]